MNSNKYCDACMERLSKLNDGILYACMWGGIDKAVTGLNGEAVYTQEDLEIINLMVRDAYDAAVAMVHCCKDSPHRVIGMTLYDARVMFGGVVAITAGTGIYTLDILESQKEVLKLLLNCLRAAANRRVQDAGGAPWKRVVSVKCIDELSASHRDGLDAAVLLALSAVLEFDMVNIYTRALRAR